MHRSRTVTTTTRSADVAHGTAVAWTAVAGTRPSPWYVDALPWAVRGGLDRLAGGEGRRWPVPDGARLVAGDHAGFWRVVESVPPDDGRPGRLVLEAEVRAPGRVRLTTTVAARGRGRSRLAQTTHLQPHGLLGWTYLTVDLAARETVSELAFRRLLRDLPASG